MNAPDNSESEKLPPAPELPRGPLGEGDGHSPFPVVGIGASAGGLEAISQLLSGMPTNTGMAFVVVQHLDPRHESRLPELLARATRMPVLEAAHGLAVRPNHVYVIPPNTKMALAQGILHVTPREERRGPHLPIDFLFRSLAEDQQARAVAVVLSGTGSDGTQGLCEIKAQGGITFAQDEKTAAHPGMPQSAVASGCVDFVLPPEQLARRLGEIGGHPYLAPAPPKPDGEPHAQENYQKILGAVRAVTGVDFSHYRDTTIKRRIMRRMAVNTQQSLTEYAERLKTEPAEVEALYQDLLINVTSFFRDPELFEALKTSVFPEVIKGKSPAQPFRIWSPGCSTGQEAFSLAMTLIEFYDNRPVRPPIQIFATDLDQNGLDKARGGLFPEGIEGEMSAERLRRFFHREDHMYRIDKSIRDMCVFARHNVTADPPFSHLDMISCRNVLIYLTTPLQRRILSAFHYALNIPGFLALGSAETVGEFGDQFELADRPHRIYSKKSSHGRHAVVFPLGDYRAGAAFLSTRPGVAGSVVPDFQREADRILLGRYAPPGVLLDESFNIIQFRGRTSAYLEPPSGEPTTQILKMTREGLFLELRGALVEAKKYNRTVRRQGIRVRTNGGHREIAVEVIPVRTQGGSTCYLVLFQEPSVGLPAPEPPPEPLPATEAEAGRELVQLRQELVATREYLQSMVEQQDASNEELRSANEEILSSNEELQSTNEELETAKEELQSANEELSTVNEQLQRRNMELDLVNNDLTNLLSSSSIPVVMVGGDLRLRRITGPAKKAMNLLPTDVGRPISDLNFTAIAPDLEQLLTEVIENVRPVEREVRDREGRWYVMRVHPYRTTDNKIDGAVIVFLDVNQIHHAQEELEQKTAQLGEQVQLIELSQDAIVVRDAENTVRSWNRGAQAMYGWTEHEVKGKSLDELLHTDPAACKELNDQLDRTGTWEGELLQTRKDGTPILVLSREVLVRDASGRRSAVLAIKRDITELRRVMEALREADRRKDEFLATLAHELRNPLAPIRNAVEIIRLAGKDPTAIAGARDVLDRQGRQLSRIVEDLIDVTRIVEEKIQLCKEWVALSAVVEMALETCRSRIEGRRHQLSVTLPPEPVYLHADPGRLSQVLINLLDNAAKYTPPGGQIWLSAERVPDDENEFLELRVRDTGIGIQADLLPHVFEMFTQGSRSVEAGRGGLGVGLTLVRSLVQMHGGSVEVRSGVPQLGSEFVVHLPLTKGPPEQEVVAPAAPTATVTSRRILVVDDNHDQAESLAILLRLMGHEVRVAEDGAETLQATAEFTPEVLLLDIGLPGMNGYEVARRLRKEPRFRNVLFIAQTGWGQEEDRRSSKEAGFDYHLVKPVTPEDLEKILANHPAK
jgi:two-component system CheB/CheR fusion protein